MPTVDDIIVIGNKPSKKTDKVLGCTPEEFKEHIERQFSSGMSWNNRSEWHLDHIVPISKAESLQDVYDLNHYSNFQPLWIEDNLRKSNKENFKIGELA